MGRGFAVAPEVGLEPTTNRLTADRSTTELLRIFRLAQRAYILPTRFAAASASLTPNSHAAEAPLARAGEWLRGRDLNPRSRLAGL